MDSVHDSRPASATSQPTRLVIFQQNDSGAEKIKGLTAYGKDLVITEIFNLTGSLPGFIDNPQDFIPANFDGDLVLSFLNHPDLLDYLIEVCRRKKIPVVASGKKAAGALTPFTCCGLGQKSGLGSYGERFGFPELFLRLDRDGRIVEIEVIRGASCGATWEAAAKVVGLSPREALTVYAREVQYLCKADPSAFDPISGRSSLHYAGHVHSAALKKAAEEAAK